MRSKSPEHDVHWDNNNYKAFHVQFHISKAHDTFRNPSEIDDK